MKRREPLLLAFSMMVGACGFYAGNAGKPQPAAEEPPALPEPPPPSVIGGPTGPLPEDGSGAGQVEKTFETAVAIASVILKDTGVNALALADASTFALTDVALTSSPTKKLVKIAKDGIPAALTLPADFSDPCLMVNARENGVVLFFSSVFTHKGVDRDFEVPGVVWLKRDGSLVALPSQIGQAIDCSEPDTKGIYTRDGYTWFLTKDGVLWKFDHATSKVTQVSDSNQTIVDFLAARGSQVVISGKVNSTGASFLRRVKANGGFEDLAASLSGFAVPGSKIDGTVLDDGLLISGLALQVYNDKTFFMRTPITTKVTDHKTPVIGGKWVLAKGAAINLGEFKFASSVSDYFSGVDSAQGIFQDSAGNLFQTDLSKNPPAYSSYLTLKYPNGLQVSTPPIVYGPDNGFTGDTWAVLAAGASGSGVLYDLDKQGFVSNARDVTLPDTSDAPTQVYMVSNAYLIGTRKGHIYKADVTTSPVVLAEIPGAISLYRPSDLFGGAHQAPSTSRSLGVGQNGQSIVHGGVLYTTVMRTGLTCALSGLVKIDPTGSGSMAPIYLTAPPQASMGEQSSFDIAERGICAIRIGADGNPELQVRDLYTYVMSTDWSFSTVAALSAQVTLPQVSPIVSTAFLPLFFDKSGVSFSAHNSVVYTFSNGSYSSLGALSVATEGYFPFETTRTVEVVAPWTDTTGLYSTTDGFTYRVHRFDVLARTRTELPEMAGIQVYTASPGADGVLIVNGLDVDNNKIVTFRYGSDGRQLSKDETSGVRLYSVVPLSSD